MKIEVLQFTGCRSHPSVSEMVREVVSEHSVDAEVEEVEVRDQPEAERLRFLGSPSVRVDGVDIEPDAASRADYGLG